MHVLLAGQPRDRRHHLVSDHVAEESAGIGEYAGVVYQLGEDIVLEAGREGLDPAELAGFGQQHGRDLAEKGVGEIGRAHV